jgi:hypothetical protein
MGYGVSPSLLDLAPGVLRWYYENARNGTYKDFLVAGPSGSGYTYPTMWPTNKLDAYLSRLNTFMGAADLHICQILDFNLNRMDIWNKYLAQTNIDALFYFPYGSSTSGQILWSTNGKQVIAQRDVLWAGIEEEPTLISHINSRPTTPSNAAGYTLVLVHVWTKSLSNVRTVVNALNPTVRVVTPDAFVKLIEANLGPSISRPRLSMLFSGGNVVLTWPTNAPNFSLQSTTTLSPTAWSLVSPPPVVVNGQNTVTNPATIIQQFYRLSQ